VSVPGPVRLALELGLFGLAVGALVDASANDAPTADFSVAPATPAADESVTFDAAESSDADGTVESYEWDFDGDGTVDATGETVSTSYASTGNRTVVLTVVDDDGAADIQSRTVVVESGGSTSTASVTTDRWSTSPVHSLRLSLRG
jgi:PKD repeat protein